VTERYDLVEPERVALGALGPVGKRTFVLQVREGARLVTCKLEKQQVAALSRHLARLLAGLELPEELPSGDFLELEDFEEPEFVVGTLGIRYDEATDRVLLVADEVVAEEAEEPRVSLSIVLTRGQAAAVAIRGVQLVEAGRPPCPICGYPLDPRGHVCPRQNGHEPPLT
jgi:uncharacterized repeat protein (TIGR03847 family)